MKLALKEALLKRNREWEAFHEWERGAHAEITIEERVEWYAAAFDFVRSLPAKTATEVLQDKISRIRDVQARLKHLKPGYRHG
jgi:hypothetical protein